ncbi:MAG: bifunctional [glutamate--ammonia ligase]-adenylyl-L-tyrosine phosphorylase/[glutamate--ammonia-ligase] adenylyltransferase [Pseudomonadota bacterium]
MSPALQEWLRARLGAFAERAPQSQAALDAASPTLRTAASRVLLGSDFVARSITRHDDLLPGLIADGSLDVARDLATYEALVAQVSVNAGGDEAAFMAALRRLRQREFVRITWRDLSGDADVDTTLAELSWFAEAVLGEATRFAGELLAKRHGMPSAAGAELVVLGMGKLGGGELNFSSDIDLVFLYSASGETQGAEPLDCSEYYARQGRTLIRLLDAPTDEGFVFRVDMRLRPFGDSGPLACSFASFEDYLQAHGRDWERYAYVKARALTGRQQFATVRESVLRPFVYRRYLDFGVFESLREMKGLIAREVERREMAEHIKLGPGGIREIEFIVQAFQLIRGGQDRSLREPSLLSVLPRLRGAKLLPAAAVQELAAAYRFLRRLENRLQMLDDQQTHSLPVDPLVAERIAIMMDAPDFATLRQQLDAHRRLVTQHFDAVVLAPADARSSASARLDLAPLWEPTLDSERLQSRLAEAGVAEPAEVMRLLDSLRSSASVRRLDEVGRLRLKALLESLVHELPAVEPLPVLRRLITIIEAIGQRSAYFALLLENAAARRRLVEVCAHGNFLATRIAAHPMLLDELIDDRVLEELPERAALSENLAALAGEVADEDPDRQVEALCRFQRAAIFRVALADLSGRLPVMHVSDRLTEIAELIVAQAMQFAWTQTTAKLGVPRCEPMRRAVQVAAIGYGKLGGRELGYSSDLDLVFIHDSAGDNQETDAATPVDNQVFFLRYTQRLLHLLTVHSAMGRLYEVDVRLRPSGKGGMLVTSIAAFRDYQFKEAWTWEHQALLHARAVAGPPALISRLEELRMDVLQNAVHRDDLQEKVRDMRERMRRELSAAPAGQVDLKQVRGGIADIEFLAQYWALKWAREYPPVALFSDTIRQLESVASAALVPQATVDQLVGAYQTYRQHGHRRALDGEDNLLAAAELQGERQAVAAIWNATMQGAAGL